MIVSSTNFEDLIDGLHLPDSNDRHVLAAAIRGRADVIVTYNTKDFPVWAMRPYGIDVQTPDQFIVNLLTLDEDKVIESVRIQRNRLRKPPLSAEQLLEKLEKQKLHETVAHLRSEINRI